MTHPWSSSNHRSSFISGKKLFCLRKKSGFLRLHRSTENMLPRAERVATQKISFWFVTQKFWRRKKNPKFSHARHSNCKRFGVFFFFFVISFGHLDFFLSVNKLRYVNVFKSVYIAILMSFMQKIPLISWWSSATRFLLISIYRNDILASNATSLICPALAVFQPQQMSMWMHRFQRKSRLLQPKPIWRSIEGMEWSHLSMSLCRTV